jgi:hypothetical protein
MSAPHLRLVFQEDIYGCMDGLHDSEMKDLSRLVELSRTPGEWQRYLRDKSIASARIFFPMGQCGHRRASTAPRNARLHVVIGQERRQSWLGGYTQLRRVTEFLA